MTLVRAFIPAILILACLWTIAVKHDLPKFVEKCNKIWGDCSQNTLIALQAYITTSPKGSIAKARRIFVISSRYGAKIYGIDEEEIIAIVISWAIRSLIY